MLSATSFLASATLTFAVLLFVHFRMLAAVWRSESSRQQKWLSWLPFWTPVAAWNAKLRLLPSVWGILLVLYLALRVLRATANT